MYGSQAGRQIKNFGARRELEIVRREVGDHPNVLYYLGRLDLDDRNLSGAIKNLSQAAAKPPFPDTSYYLGFAYFKQGDLPAAEKWLKEEAAKHGWAKASKLQVSVYFLEEKHLFVPFFDRKIAITDRQTGKEKKDVLMMSRVLFFFSL